MALTNQQIDEGIASLTGWARDGNAIRREYTFGSFREAISFIVRISFEAEQRDHHPELANVYNRVTIRLSTHDAGGITEKDFDLARAIDAINWT
ncbi:MAG: 4a-hydroxytetrahydrobiopterin dehydratase [Dehalococcoidia bacterium]